MELDHSVVGRMVEVEPEHSVAEPAFETTAARAYDWDVEPGIKQAFGLFDRQLEIRLQLYHVPPLDPGSHRG
jgi:hypothetical protein